MRVNIVYFIVRHSSKANELPQFTFICIPTSSDFCGTSSLLHKLQTLAGAMQYIYEYSSTNQLPN
jgi:hypothetical protein